MLPPKAMRLLRRLEAHNINQTTGKLVEGKKLNKSKSVFLMQNRIWIRIQHKMQKRKKKSKMRGQLSGKYAASEI